MVSHQNARPRIALLSRQRLVGAVGGSATYVLSIARALKRTGFAIDFIGASPKIFGRWPVLRLKPETAVFDTYAIRGGWRFGRWVFALDPRVAFQAALAVLEAALARLKLVRAGWARPAPYAIAAPASRADQHFVARRSRASTRAILCDYAFLTPLAPHVRPPNAPRIVIMHDLMSARASLPGEERVPAEIAALSADEEFRLLSLADAVVAIQPQEADEVRRRLPSLTTLLAPFAVDPAPAPQAGRDDRILFVGANTGPNVVGLNWFFAEVWPLLRAERPDVELWVAGSVCRGAREAPAGVRILGFVEDLTALYRDAGVVISPVLTGSGLKIKLVEAMAAGKAIVATGASLRGAEALVGGAVRCADDPAAFAGALNELLGDAALREKVAAGALRCARERFSESVCYGPLIDYIRRSVSEAVVDATEREAAEPR